MIRVTNVTGQDMIQSGLHALDVVDTDTSILTLLRVGMVDVVGVTATVKLGR